nr:DUF3099 domain-containing protein [Isoptericola halotolerans]
MFQMGLRLVLILAAALLVEGWLMWVCFAGAVVLPYSAVLLANAGRDRSSHESSGAPPLAPPEIEATAPATEEPHIRVVDHVDAPSSTPADSPADPEDR